MAFEPQTREALYLLQGIENGTLASAEAARLVEQADPALVYLLFTWLRERYGRGHPAAEGVLGRVLEITSRSSRVEGMLREGKADPITTWFEEVHEYRDFDAESFVALVVEKLES